MRIFNGEKFVKTPVSIFRSINSKLNFCFGRQRTESFVVLRFARKPNLFIFVSSLTVKIFKKFEPSGGDSGNYFFLYTISAINKY